jgi:hypothetical protein
MARRVGRCISFRFLLVGVIPLVVVSGLRIP